MYATVAGSQHAIPPSSAAKAFFSLREAIAEDLPKYLSSEYNDFEILDEADTTSVDQGKSVNFNRRKTLFNLYAFTYSDTWQKDRNGLEGN